jgi:hypothetical protein
MSDPVTNVEIEDVLASIRRLVLEAAQPVAALPEPDVDGVQGRLVLTPALRVVEPRAPLAGLQGTASEAEPDDVIPAMPDPGALHPVESGEEQGLTDVAAVRAGLLEAATTALPGEWEPDGSEAEPEMDWSRATPEDALMFRSRHGMPLRLDRRVDRVELVEEPAFRHKPALTEATVEPPVTPEPAPVQAVATAPLAVAVDEAMLRRIVAEVLQQELQGALGERITRNVRKLVRREINRAMMDGQDD